MDTKTQIKRLESYYKIFEQIYKNNRSFIYEIAKKTKLARNTVSKYLEEMYEKTVITGPRLEMKSTCTYKEYVYLMNFSDPSHVYEGLKGFPHVVYHALTFGDWNTLVIANRLLDFSQLMGFQNMVYRNVKYCCHTPPVVQTTWEQSFSDINKKIAHFTPGELEKRSGLAPALPWGDNEWKLFFAFKDNIRKKITPTLREIGVHYSTYREWLKNLGTFCTVHTGFYPEGYHTYQHHCLLFFTPYKSVISLLSLFPSTSVFMEVGDQLLAVVNPVYSGVIRALICTIYDMAAVNMIEGFKKAQIITEWYHGGSKKAVPNSFNSGLVQYLSALGVD